MKIVKNYLANITIIIFSIILSVVAIEFLLRLTIEDLSNKKYNIMPGWYAKGYAITCDYGWCPQPGVYRTKKVYSAGIIYDVVYTIGSNRKRLFTKDKTHSKKTIISTPEINFFGGSFMYGEGLNDNETLPYFFSKYTSSYDFINHGFHGYGVHNALYFLEKLNKLDAGSINVLLTGAYHASRSSCNVSYSNGHPKYILKAKQNVLRPTLIGKCQSGKSEHVRNWKYNLIKNFVLKLAPHSAIAKIISPYVTGPTDSEINLYINLIIEMSRVSVKRGERFIVLFLNQPRSSLALTSYDNEMIKSILVDGGIEVIDATLADDLATLESKYYLHEADKHPSKIANLKRAKILAEYLGIITDMGY